MHNKIEYKTIQQIGVMTPGPGAYEFSLKNKKAAPSFGTGSEKRSFEYNKGIKAFPASNVYKPSDNFTKTTSSAWGFGSEQRKGPVNLKN